MEQYIIANWKMNGTQAEAEKLASTLVADVHGDDDSLPHIVLCPSYPYLPRVCGLLKDSPLKGGAQDCSSHKNGAFTGEVSATQLKDTGCDYVIVGHSERRRYHQETNVLIRQKIEAALHVGMKPILCIGETEDDYRTGNAFAVISEQLETCLPAAATPTNLLIAYEPVWAIGTGLTPTVEAIEELTSILKQKLSALMPEGDLTPVLYGGSVTPANAFLFLGLPGVDGVLVGGASLRLEDFWHIIKAVKR